MEGLVHNKEQPEKISRGSKLFESLGVREGEPIPLEKIKELLLANKGEIVTGLQRNYYHVLKNSLYGARAMNISAPNYVARQKDRVNYEAQNTKVVDFIWFLESDQTMIESRWKRNEEAKLIFTFSVPKERVHKELVSNAAREYSGDEAFGLENIYLTYEGMGSLDKESTRKSIASLEEASLSGSVPSHYFKQFLERVLQEPTSFSLQEQELDMLWGKHAFNPEDLIKMKRGIWEFGNYEFNMADKGSDGSFIGQCLVIPGKFEGFMRRRFGLQLENIELFGVGESRRKLSREEQAELHAERAESAVHYASLYNRAIIIDWTSRQFNPNLPFPQITDIEEDQKLKHQIEINGRPVFPS